MKFFNFFLLQAFSSFIADAMMLNYKREGLGDFMSSWQARVGEIHRVRSLRGVFSTNQKPVFIASANHREETLPK